MESQILTNVTTFQQFPFACKKVTHLLATFTSPLLLAIVKDKQGDGGKKNEQQKTAKINSLTLQYSNGL